MELIAAIAAALAVLVLVYTLATPSGSSDWLARAKRFERADSDPSRQELLSRPFTQRVFEPIAIKFRSATTRLLPGKLLDSLQRRLVVAGEPVSLFAFLGIASLFAIAGVAMVVATLVSGPEARLLALFLFASLAVASMPWLWLMNTIQKRKADIQKALPDAVDLIVTTVEAGMAIDASLAEVGRETRGPLGAELRMAVRETALGRSRRDALSGVVERTELADVKTFINAVIQAEQSGVPIGPVLRTQAGQVRLKRRQRAEEAIQRAPVKMIIVMGALILPSLILIIMGPSVLRVLDQL